MTSSANSQRSDRPSAPPSPSGLALVVATAFVHSLWSLFQWTQLVVARTGGESFCGLGDTDSASCIAIWDSPFARAIQEWTGVPVAGWGLIWSVAAFLLPLWALAQRAGETGDSERRTTGSAWAATVWMALGGLGAIAVLGTASVVQGHLCTTCVVTYTIVAIYAAICFVQTPIRSVPLAQGISLAAGALGLSFVLLFIPGLRTPLSQSEAGKKVLDSIVAPARPTTQEPSAPGAAPLLDDVLASLTKLLEELPPELEQAFSDELNNYATARHVPMRQPRALVGAPSAPVRLTEFTDAMCTHCASLHETMAQLAQTVPAGSFALEARHFPLDPSCNPHMEGESSTPVRCLAAKSVICVEGREEAFEYAGRVYQHQQNLSEEKVYELAAPLMSHAELASCVNDPATLAKLRDDIDWATEHDIHGTPLVLLNGKPVAPFAPLLYALILTGGDSAHPIFAKLPAPRPTQAHAHEP